MGPQLGEEKEADVVIIVEALDDHRKTNQHGTYNVVLNTAYKAVYARKDLGITCRKKGKGEMA